LVSVIVVDRDDIALDRSGRPLCGSEARRLVLREMERTVSFLAKHRAPARPIISTVIRSRRVSGENENPRTETYVEEEGLAHVRRAVEEGEIPVLIPVALDQGCKTNLMEGNDVVRALAESMGRSGKDYAAALVAENGPAPSSASSSVLNEAPIESPSSDMTPLRLLIINREGGIPSYARSGMPHLSINLETEYDFIQDTFLGQWETTHPSALANLTLARDCLAHMPSSASALIASHKSPAALIANLITNKPAHSASLPHALLAEGEGKITPHTPTLIRKGMPIRIIRSFDDIDRPKLKTLLERSFGRTLNEEAFWSRMARSLDFAIVAGDYAAAALCTNEGPSGPGQTPICYLDKFAVLPSHQGDGTVDFLWVALRDETFGLGLKDAANANIGSLAGVGSGRDLIWRSRADNPVNKWYYERSNGFVTLGSWKMFWCDAEQRIRELKSETGSKRDRGIPIKVVEDTEQGRLLQWASYVEPIPSAWS
jgi:amino-acid N-acetyltransferase